MILNVEQLRGDGRLTPDTCRHFQQLRGTKWRVCARRREPHLVPQTEPSALGSEVQIEAHSSATPFDLFTRHRTVASTDVGCPWFASRHCSCPRSYCCRWASSATCRGARVGRTFICCVETPGVRTSGRTAAPELQRTACISLFQMR